MDDFRTLCGRDVSITINGRRLLQAESAELRKKTELHRVRSCFCSNDLALIEGKREYKLNLVGIRFEAPFENCNFFDLDQFTVKVVEIIIGVRIFKKGLYERRVKNRVHSPGAD